MNRRKFFKSLLGLAACAVVPFKIRSEPIDPVTKWINNKRPLPPPSTEWADYNNSNPLEDLERHAELIRNNGIYPHGQGILKSDYPELSKVLDEM